MTPPTGRQRILEALHDLPDDATIDDAIERLIFLAKIDAGLAELDAGKGIPHQEVKRRLGAVIRLIWSPQPLRDLQAIRDYVAADSPRYAALVVERIIRGVERLTSLPESGRVVPERSDPQLREVIVGPSGWSTASGRR